MKQHRRSAFVFFGLLLFLPGGVRGDDVALDLLPVVDSPLKMEPRVAVMAAEATLDGVEHGALGRSLSDSLIGGMLEQGRSKVFSYEEGTAEEEPVVAGGTPAEAVAGILGRRLGADKVLVPRLVGEGEFYRFTVKEVDAGSYEVTRVFELSHTGDREGIFGFVPMVLEELARDGKNEGTVERAQPVIKIWTWEEYRNEFGANGTTELSPGQGADTVVEEVIGAGEESVAPVARVARPVARMVRAEGRRVEEMVALGRVRSVNDQWGFCVIDMMGRKLKADEEIEIREGGSDTVYATLVVTSVEGDKAIADLAKVHGGKRPLVGDVVFGWVNPRVEE